MKTQIIIAALRDIACYLVGIYGITHQEITGHVHGELLAVYVVLLGVPGGITISKALLGGKSILGMGLPQSSSQGSSSSSQSSESSSPNR